MSSWSTGTNVIKEVDTNKNLTCQMFEVRKQGGGTEYLVRKSDVTLGTKSVTQNGTYTAAADGKYGISQFSVNVRGGNGSADSHGKPTGGDIKPGGAGSAVVGTDPETGEEVVVGVDEDGNIVQTPIPYGIKIVTPPTKTDYNAGDDMDYSGIVVGLKKKDGTTFTDSRYPNGHIPMGELVFPVEVAPDVDGRDGQSRDGAYYTSSGGAESVCTQPDGTGGNVIFPAGTKYCGLKRAGSTNFYVIAISTTGPIDGKAVTQNTGEEEREWTTGTTTYLGSTAYYWSMAWTNPPPAPTIDYTELSPTESRSLPQVAAEIILGSTSGNASIPVQWESPYNGKTLEDTFKITVTGAGSSHTTESSSGTEGSGGGGTF